MTLEQIAFLAMRHRLKVEVAESYSGGVRRKKGRVTKILYLANPPKVIITIKTGWRQFAEVTLTDLIWIEISK